MRRAAAWLAALSLGLPAVAAADAWTYRGAALAAYDGNAGNSGASHDRQGSGFLRGVTSATREQPFGSRTTLQISESIALERWLRLQLLTNVRYGARARMLHRPGGSFHAPVLGAWVEVGARHAATDIRKDFDYHAGVSATAPVTTAVEARLESSWSRRVARHGRAFDLDSVSYSLDVDWRAGDGRTIYAGVRVDDGDFTVTARGFGIVAPKDQHLYLEPRASAIEADPAFGQDWWAFRVDGITRTLTLGMNLRLSRVMSLDVQVLRGEARMDRFTYERWVGSAGLLFRW